MVKKIVENMVYLLLFVFILWVFLSWGAIVLRMDNSYNFFNILEYTYFYFFN